MARLGFVFGPLYFLVMAGNVLAQTPTTTAVTPAKVDYANDVRPILQENCVTCHGPLKQRGGMRLDRKSSATKAFSRRIVPGSSENSFLYHRLKGEFGAPMPPDGALKADQIATIKAWIDQGAEWPDALANELDLPAPSAKTLAMVDMLRTNNMAGFMKAATAGPFVAVQDGFYFLDGFFGQVVEFEEHRAVAAHQFVVELLHHRAAPVVAFDEAFTL